MSQRRVVVTGLGAVTPLGHDVASFWSGLIEGRSGISQLTKFDTSDYPVKIGGEIRGLPLEKFLDSKAVNRTDPATQFAVFAAEEAMADAGLKAGEFNGERFGCILGSGIGGLLTMQEECTKLTTRGPRRVSPLLVPKMMINAASGELAIRFALLGPNFTTASACASANHAIGLAYQQILLDQCDQVLTGGTECALVELGFAGFCSARALSRRNEEPARASRPFDKGRDGFVFSEGAGLLVLEELETAKKRGAKIYCEVLGFGMSDDSFHITAPHEGGDGAARAMREALRSAKRNPSDVQYLNAHGTSTELGDIAETRAIKQVFGEHSTKLAISSTKSMVGHLLGASGGVEAIALARTILDKKIHPTLNLEEPDPDCDLDYVPGATRELAIDVGLSNSFGFGGHNTAVVFGRFKD